MGWARVFNEGYRNPGWLLWLFAFFFFAGASVSQSSRCAVLPLLAEILFPAFDPQHLRDGFAFRISLAEPGM